MAVCCFHGCVCVLNKGWSLSAKQLFLGCLSIVEKPVVFEVGLTDKLDKMPLTTSTAIDQLQSAYNRALGSK